MLIDVGLIRTNKWAIWLNVYTIAHRAIDPGTCKRDEISDETNKFQRKNRANTRGSRWNIFCQKIKNQNRFIIVVWMYSEFSSDLFDSFQINVETKMISKLIVSQRIRRQWCCSALSPCLVTRMATATRQKKAEHARVAKKQTNIQSTV